MTPDRHRLLISKLRELSVVTKPANADALIMLHKSDDSKDRRAGFRAWLTKAMRGNPTLVDAVVEKAEQFVTDTREDAVTDDVLKDYSDADMEKEMRKRAAAKAAAKKSRAAAADDADDDEGEDDDQADGSPSEAKKKMKKAATTAVTKSAEQITIEKQAEEIADLRKKFEAAETAREDAGLLIIAKAMIGDVGSAPPDKLAPILKKLTVEERVVVAAVFKQANELLKTSQVFGVIGSDGRDAPSAMDDLEKAADEIQKADPKLSDAQAMDRATKQNPDLYAAVVRATERR